MFYFPCLIWIKLRYGKSYKWLIGFFFFFNCFTVQYFQKKFAFNWHVHIQPSRVCVWRRRSVAVKGTGYVTRQILSKNSSVLYIKHTVVWLASTSPASRRSGVRSGTSPARGFPEKTSVGKLPRLIVCLPTCCTGRVSQAGFLSSLNAMRGLHFPRKHTEALS